jgi:hypothetical protein
LREVFLDMSSGANDLVLKIDGKLLNLPQQETRQRVACSLGSRLVCEQLGKLEHAGWIGRLDYIEPFPSRIEAEFESMPTHLMSKVIDQLSDVSPEIGVRVGRGTDLLVAGDTEYRQGLVERPV